MEDGGRDGSGCDGAAVTAGLRGSEGVRCGLRWSTVKKGPSKGRSSAVRLASPEKRGGDQTDAVAEDSQQPASASRAALEEERPSLERPGGFLQ